MKRSNFHGRRKPYTELGISRVPCARCGKPSARQWQVCANDNLFLGVCQPCDVELNRRTLKFFRIANTEELLEAYSSEVKRSGRSAPTLTAESIPQLLEALREPASRSCEGQIGRTDYVDCKCWTCRARAAIEKATSC